MKKVICNPLNLEYRYQLLDGYEGKSLSREAADPTMVLFKGKYLLFVSKTGGFWYSDDLFRWEFKETPELPAYDYAPDVRVVNGAVVFSASDWNKNCPFYRSEDPIHVPFEQISASFLFYDPNIFEDDDGRVYFYWGCTNKEPIWGIELDAAALTPIGEKTALLQENEADHVWERRGENNRLEQPQNDRERMILAYIGTKPYIEGAYMTRYNGLYYLQYAAPGTQYNTYADGVYIGRNPLGPFRYQTHNPFSAKPGGFIHGAGHGSTFQDKAGNWWHASTMRISCHDKFERRIGLFPCGFDGDGVLFCGQAFSDYPFALPSEKKPPMEIGPEWMLLSYNKKTTASSSIAGHKPTLAVNESIRSWWAAERRGKDEWLQVDLGEVMTVCAVQLNFADQDLTFPDIAGEDMRDEAASKRYIEVKPQQIRYQLEGSEDGVGWRLLHRAVDGDYAHDLVVLPEAARLRYLRVSGMVLPYDGLPAVSGFRVFGKGNGSAPAMVESFKVSRMEDGVIALSWDAVSGADGYNIRYGARAGKLYSCWQVNGACQLDLTMVNKDNGYVIAIDSFNENGVTPGREQHCD